MTESNDQTMPTAPAKEKPVGDMTEREMLTEILTHMRAVGAAVGEVQRVGMGGMIKMLMSSKGK